MKEEEAKEFIDKIIKGSEDVTYKHISKTNPPKSDTQEYKDKMKLVNDEKVLMKKSSGIVKSVVENIRL